MTKTHLNTLRALPEKAVFYPPKNNAARQLAFFFMMIVPLLYGLAALALGQDANWDFRNYHWYNAYALVTGRYGMDILPSQTPFFYNPALDVPYYLLATHVPARLAGFLLGLVQGLNFVFLFMIAHVTLQITNLRRRVLIAATLAFLGVFGGGSIAQIGTSFYDNITSLGLWLSILIVYRSWNFLVHGVWWKSAAWAVFAGLPAGVMMGLKLPFVTFCVGLCLSFLFVSGRKKRRVMNAFFFGCGVLLGCAVSYGSWGTFLATEFGNPFFPYFNDLIQSPMGHLSSARDTKFLPQGLWEKALFPFLFGSNPLRVGEIPWRDARIPVLYAVLPVALLVRMAYGRTKRDPDALTEPHHARFLLWIAVLSYAVWVNMFAIYRYLLPLEMLSPLLIVIAIGFLPIKTATRGLAAAFLLGGIAVSVQGGDWGRHTPWLDRAVEVTLPNTPELRHLLDNSTTMLLMAGYEPYSHVLTAFPADLPVVRLQSNYLNPEDKIGLNDRIRSRIEGHTGGFLMLVPAYHHELAKMSTRPYNLTFLPQTCQKVDDKLYDSQLHLCVVTSQNKGISR